MVNIIRIIDLDSVALLDGNQRWLIDSVSRFEAFD